MKRMYLLSFMIGFFVLFGAVDAMAVQRLSYPIVDTGQTHCYGNNGQIVCPSSKSQPFYGEDAQFDGLQPAYRDNGDGTITDLNTGLMWVKARGKKVTWAHAVAGASKCRVGGYTDWRMPTIKELYSLINFTGGIRPGMGRIDPAERSAADSIPYIDTRYFGFKYGDPSQGVRGIDCQDWSATRYVSTTMRGAATIFGVNFADGRIKGYPLVNPPKLGPGYKKLYVRYVRGNPAYGKNEFRLNGNGTVSDLATGLMWSTNDSGHGMNWEQALAWVQMKNREHYLGYSDWRLPNAKELQSIVDYHRSPDTTDSAAINPIFHCTSIINAAGQKDYPYYWTSTTHLDNHGAVYIAFGRALGWMQIPPHSAHYDLLDVHGAGAQRSDPKAGNPADYPHGRGPQGDVIRIYNYVRLVRGGGVKPVSGEMPVAYGNSSGTERNHSQRRMPPAVAVKACWGHSAGDTVEFQTPRGRTVRGVCREIQGELACVPNHRSRRPSMGSGGLGVSDGRTGYGNSVSD